MIVRGLFFVLVLLLSRPAIASDSPVYESFHGVTIGRVFLSQEHRNSLDRRRLQLPRRVQGPTSARVEDPAGKAPPPAGYIIGPNGRSKTWRDGDFVETARKPAQRMSFPGDVAVKRHPAPETSANDGDAD